MSDKKFAEGIYLKEFDTKFGKAMGVSVNNDFIRFLMRNMGKDDLQLTIFKKKTATQHTTHYMVVNDHTGYSKPDVEEKFQEKSSDNVSEETPEDCPF